LSKHKIENAQSVCSNQEQHVFVVAQFKEGVYMIDIPYDVYESGGGYTWKKKNNIIFNRDHIVIRKLDNDPDKFNQYVD
jgi:hypothetical protein